MTTRLIFETVDPLNPQATVADNGYAPQTLASALNRVAQLQAALAAQGLHLREPPQPPTSCCGRGCNGCVWEGYFAAVTYWTEQACELLDPPAGIRAPAPSRSCP